MQETRGWSVASVSSAITLYYLAGAALVALVGDAYARLGPRTAALIGMAAMGLAAGSLPLLTAPWQTYLAFLAMAPGWALMSGAAVNAVLAPRFDRRRGLAISLALNGASFGGVLVAPALIALIAAFGFRAGMHVATLGMGLILTAVVLLTLPRGGARAASAAPAPSSVLLRDIRFWSVAGPFALALMSQVGFLTHQVSFVGAALGSEAAAAVVGLTTLAAVAGRVGAGFFIDRFDRRAGAAANLMVQAVGLALLIWAPAPAAIWTGCLLFGLGVGNLITYPSLIVQAEFAPADFARVVSLSLSVGQFTFAFGPGLLGVLRDASGGYGAPIGLCLALHAAAAAILLIAGRGGATSGRRPATPAA